ncbi:8-oxo-dGTP diphosphatase [Paeniglutamicibacter cryotolerans]|uniref:Oxidized purine nucleoside triphosphate hydrolase n=1 Tax=Paeniglutamicibacter cryotolerans TaxID=670079 RepID=A0A839QKA3_9MICC|nr:NUDIX domain-containing protein [Paeniglutamicibacter cryotolerans]MBB2996277.1 8-oxo-dGTP diphosphatase [Paeniglutamicibacter cryotolerans]
MPKREHPVNVVLCLPVRGAGTGAEVLLGLKRHGFGAGKVVAPGGKIEPGEAPADAATRELREETGLGALPDSLEPAARVLFRFPAAPAADMDCTVFLTRVFTGHAVPTDELLPEWHPVSAPPYPRMWDDSAYWLGLLLDGRRFDARIVLAENNQAVARFDLVDWMNEKIPSHPATATAFPDIT